MKHIKILAALALLLAASCSRDEEPQIWKITPDFTPVLFSADGLSVSLGNGWRDEPATFTVTVPKNESWDVTSTRSWVHIAKTANTFTLSADPVDLVAPERAGVSIKSGENILWSAVVEQEAALSVYPLNPVVFSLQGIAGNKTFRVHASRNREWDAVSSESWLNVSKNADEGTFSLSAAANTAATAPPPATVTVSSGTATPIVIDVTQEGPVLTVTPAGTALVFSADGESAKLDGEPLNSLFFEIYTNIKEPTVSITSSQYWVHIGTVDVNDVVVGFWISASPNTFFPWHHTGTITITVNSLPPVIMQVSQLL
ncbi:MAG: hypothetical protein LBJ63_11695 [Prevotellaceae bacterium]|jgi:hypothetical protein|nr:hypothetical protein [Prevotellaceae bacterium]